MKSNKILILDIETTGFSSSKDKIVEIGIVDLDIITGEKNIIFDMVFNPGLPEEELKKAWIVEKGYMTTAEIMDGEDMREHLLTIQAIIDSYRGGMTSFNKSFDNRFMKANGFSIHKELDCPMILSTPICKLPNKNGYKGFKWPSVEEAYDFFFPNNTYTELHRGGDDAYHEADIVFELIKRGVFVV